MSDSQLSTHFPSPSHIFRLKKIKSKAHETLGEEADDEEGEKAAPRPA